MTHLICLAIRHNEVREHLDKYPISEIRHLLHSGRLIMHTIGLETFTLESGNTQDKKRQ